MERFITGAFRLLPTDWAEEAEEAFYRFYLMLSWQIDSRHSLALPPVRAEIISLLDVCDNRAAYK
jgi:hypothetical protein